MLIINTGNGKGKTTAAIGQMVRALGQGQKVCFVQIFKGAVFYGEQKVLQNLKNLDFYSFAPKHPYCFRGISLRPIRLECQKAVKLLKKIARGRKKYDLIVLDEFNIGVRDGFIGLKALLDVLNKLIENTNVIITGRGAHKELLKRADLITEMKEVRHPYKKGIKASKGLEF
ncbi:MAG: cob(I)yrinic acid a,c-diamide adenosyltransferase [Elusimicrobiota bacterium]